MPKNVILNFTFLKIKLGSSNAVLFVHLFYSLPLEYTNASINYLLLKDISLQS